MYVGVTSAIAKRVWEHKNKVFEGFSKTYGLNKLVYFEVIDTIETAISREKQLRRWHRDWKLNLIKENNPDFKDLYDEIVR